MILRFVFIILLFHNILCDVGSDKCLRYYFDDNSNTSLVFTRNVLACNDSVEWEIETYANSTIAAPNESSKQFIKALPSGPNRLACIASFPFTFMPDGIIKVKVYSKVGEESVLYIALWQKTQAGNSRQIAMTTTRGAKGWYEIKISQGRLIPFLGDPPYQTYIVIQGRASSDTVMVVDSFRYVPSSMNPEEECLLYEDMTSSTTKSWGWETTTENWETSTQNWWEITTEPVSTPIDPFTTPTTEPAISTTTTAPTTVPNTTTTPPIIKPPKNSTKYYIEERFYFEKSFRISKKKTKIISYDGVEQLPLD